SITRVLPRTRSARREGLAARRGVTSRRRVAGPRRLARPPAIMGWHGPRLAARAMGRPAGAARVHSGLVAGAWRLRGGPAGGRPVLAAPAGLSSRNRPSRSRTRARGTQDLRDVLAAWRPGGTATARHVDKAAR